MSNAPKIVLTSLIDMGGNKAAVYIGKRHIGNVYRAGGAWNAQSPAGNPLLPRIPHTMMTKNTWGKEVETDVTLGAVLKQLRDTMEAKLAAIMGRNTGIAA